MSSAVIYVWDGCVLERTWLRAKEKDPVEAQEVSAVQFPQL